MDIHLIPLSAKDNICSVWWNITLCTNCKCLRKLCFYAAAAALCVCMLKRIPSTTILNFDGVVKK